MIRGEHQVEEKLEHTHRETGSKDDERVKQEVM